MQERAEAIAATLQLESSLGHGTTVALTLPFPSDMVHYTPREKIARSSS